MDGIQLYATTYSYQLQQTFQDITKYFITK